MAAAASTYSALVTTEYSKVPSKAIKLTRVAKSSPSGRDLLVKLKAFALNPVDFKKLANFGNTEAKIDTPFVAGYDGAGIVEAVGPEVKSFKAGDEVYFAGNLFRNGTFAEYAVVDERIVALKPKTLTWTQAASVPLVALTAWEGIGEGLGVSSSDADKKANANKTILIIGGAGGVGSFASQLAKHAFGLRVVTTASRPESVEFSKRHGADLVIDHTKPLLDQLKHNGIEGVEYVFNTASTVEYFEQITAVLKPLGKVVFINSPEGPVNLAPAFFKRISIVLEIMFARPMYNAEPELQGAALTSVAALIDAGAVHHTVTRTFPFTEQAVGEALELQASGKVNGKLAVSISE